MVASPPSYPHGKEVTPCIFCTLTRFESMLTWEKSKAIKHLQDKENLIEWNWKRCVLLFLLLKKFPKLQEQISCMPEFLQKNNWMTCLDRLNTFKKKDLNTFPILLLATSLQGLILREKVLKPFWTPAYKGLSENLLSPIEIGSVGSDLTSLTYLLQNREEKLPFLTMNKIKVGNKNLPKTSFQLSTSTVVSKWEDEVINLNKKLKSLKVKLKPNSLQKKVLEEWMNTSNYVYNKTIEEIKKGHNPLDFEGLRNKIITLDTKTGDNKYNLAVKLLSQLNKTKEKFVKKNEEDLIKLKFINSFIDGLKNLKIKTSKKKNINIKDWELNTPKDTRAGAVDDICKAYKTGFANLKAGNIKYFNLGYRKKDKVNKSCVVAKNAIKINNGIITISPQSFKEKKCNGNFNIGKKTRNTKKHKDLKINNDCRIIMQKGEYWVIIPIPYEVEENMHFSSASIISFTGRIASVTIERRVCIRSIQIRSGYCVYSRYLQCCTGHSE